mmetsp:Transcript_81691/g.218669  ORF Transcript_81691/g.218669 Transcript_81691/m.218669 type:complete len:492 (+) Transcript_81691:45-1520(+)
MNLLLLTSLPGLAIIDTLVDLGHDLAQHDGTIAIQESNAGQPLAVLEGVHHQRLHRAEHDLSHLVGLQRMGLRHLLASGLLANLPVQPRNSARRAPAPHETNRGIPHLDLTGDVQHLHLSGEAASRRERGVLLVNHHITSAGHVLLLQTLDVQPNIVTGLGLLLTSVVHLHSEHLPRASVGRGVRGQKHDFLTRLHNPLLHSAGQHITDTLNLVDSRHRHPHRRLRGTDRNAAELVQSIVQGVHVDLLRGSRNHNILPLVPRHVGGFLEQIVTAPPRDGHERNIRVEEILLPPDLGKHVPHLVGDLIVSSLLVPRQIAIHLVHSDDDLLHSQQVDQAGVLPGLSLDLSSLVVALLDSNDEVTIGRNHDQGHVGLRSSGNHVLDEIAVARGVNDSVVPLLGVEFLRGAGDSHTALTLLLLPIHEESEGEAALSQSIGLLAKLVQLTLRKTTQLEQQMACRCGLARIDMTTNHDGQVLLLRLVTHGLTPRRCD